MSFLQWVVPLSCGCCLISIIHERRLSLPNPSFELSPDNWHVFITHPSPTLGRKIIIINIVNGSESPPGYEFMLGTHEKCVTGIISPLLILCNQSALENHLSARNSSAWHAFSLFLSFQMSNALAVLVRVQAFWWILFFFYFLLSFLFILLFCQVFMTTSLLCQLFLFPGRFWFMEGNRVKEQCYVSIYRSHRGSRFPCNP